MIEITKCKGNRIDGIIHGCYVFSAKVHETRSTYGINGGRILKLNLWDTDNEIAYYDRGWDIYPPDVDVVLELVDVLDNI